MTQRGWRPAWLLLALALAGCGFQLQGGLSLPASITVSRVAAGPADSEFMGYLEAGLRDNGVRLAAAGPGDGHRLRILVDESGERVLSVTTEGGPEEFELFHSVRYELLDGDQPLMAPRTVTVTRDYKFDRNNVLGKEREASLLRDALAQELARLVLSQMALQWRAAGP